MRSESRSRVEYLIPANNIIVLASYFNVTSKSVLIDRLQFVLIITIFDHLAYFFGPLCTGRAVRLQGEAAWFFGSSSQS